MSLNYPPVRVALRRIAAIAIVIGVAATAANPCDAQEDATLEALPVTDPPVNRTDSGVAVTDEGVVIGNQRQHSGTSRAVRWVASEVGEGIGLLAGATSSFAHAVSEDGSIIVGTCSGTSGSNAFRWTAATGMTSIPALSENPGTLAHGISANGAFIAGSGAASGSPSWSRAARWNAQLEPIDCGYLNASIPSSSGYGISADGRVVVGSSYFTPTEIHAVRWKAGVLSDLGILAEISGSGRATAASADGGIVVGYQESTPANRAWRWTVASGMNALARVDVSSEFSRALDISDDGRVIVGWEGSSAGDQEACIWIDGVPRKLKTLLASKYDLDVAGWTLFSANGVSPDGRYVTGEGTLDGASVAFRVYLPNEAPVAKAGRNIVVTTQADEGKRVKLDGRDSFDPEGSPLRYRWSAPRVRFGDATSARPSAIFPVGTTEVTLRVTDPDRASDTDTVKVTVRPERSRSRPQGEAANQAFAESADLLKSDGEEDDASLAEIEGAALVDRASAIGDSLSDLIVWTEEETIAEATLRYAELRRTQCTYGVAAATKLAEASIETGDPATTEAAHTAHAGALRAAADLCEP